MLLNTQYTRGLLTCVAAIFSSVCCYSQLFIAEENNALLGGSGGFIWGNGISCYDVDQDGLDDLTIVRGNEYLRLLRNIGSGFEVIETTIFCSENTLQVLWVDYDNDNDLDLLHTTWSGVNRLYRNEGNYTFIDVTLEAGLSDNIALNYGASFADYDRDGWLDLYICRYYPPGAPLGFTNKLYKNNGDGTFSDVTIQAGVGDGLKPSFMGVWMDINNDLWPDLLVINDRFPLNGLYRNNGDGTFTDITESAGMTYPYSDPMSATPGDYNNDGFLDVFMSDGGNGSNMPVRLARNNGNETFTDVSSNVGLSTWEITWGAVWLDYNNDGWRDLFYCTSEILPNHLYRNLDGEIFQNVSAQVSAPLYPSYVCATGDFNNDGYSDIVVVNQTPHPSVLMHNSGGNNHYIKVTPRGTVSNKDAVGSWIRVYRGGTASHHYTLCGEGLIGQNSQHIIFGMGSDDSPIDSLCVTYPSGHTDTYFNLAVDEHYILTEGETYSVTIFSNFDLSFCAGDSILLEAGVHQSVLWSTGDTSHTIYAKTPGTINVTATNPYGIQAVESIELTQFPAPQIAATLLHPDCPNSPTGSIELYNQTGVLPFQVTWDNGAQGTLVDSLQSGMYAYSFIDIHGCAASGLLEMIDPPGLFMIVITSDEVQGEDGSISVIAFGGTPPYQILINGAESNPITFGLPADTYEVEVLDANGCNLVESVTISSVLNATAQQVNRWLIYPNPTTGIVNLVHDPGLQSISLTDLSGRVIFEKSRTVSNSINLEHLPKGTYLMTLTDSQNESYFSKLVKK